MGLTIFPSPGSSSGEGGSGAAGAAGAAGVSVTGASVRPADGHLLFTLSSGQVLDVGVLPGYRSVQVDAGTGHLIFTANDGSTADAGALPGFKAAAVSGGALVLTRLDGSTINLGNVQGAKGDKGSDGARGSDGAPGAPGTDGVTPQISATATGLPAGQAPTVTVGGTHEAPTLAFGIPKGDKGDPGTSSTGSGAGSPSATPWAALPLSSGYVRNASFGYIPQYRIVGGDTVQLRGTLSKSSGSLTASTEVTFATLPAEAAPPATTFMACGCSSSGGSGAGRIGAKFDTLTLTYYVTATTSGWLSLDGVSYSLSAV